MTPAERVALVMLVIGFGWGMVFFRYYGVCV